MLFNPKRPKVMLLPCKGMRLQHIGHRTDSRIGENSRLSNF